VTSSFDRYRQQEEQIMTNLNQVKVSPREQQVLNLLVQGRSNKEIGGQLNIALHTVKQHLRMMFLRAGIREGGKRVKLARHAREDEDAVTTRCEDLSPRENQISILVWEGLTNREIGKIIGTSEQVIKNHLRSAFDKLGVWTRLELAMYVANHGGKDWRIETGALSFTGHAGIERAYGCRPQSDERGLRSGTG
jgi:DNA-binding NarL/FixJ family response regulator